MRVIITGATGTIGSVLMECLPQKYEVIGIARGKAENSVSLDILKDSEKIKSLINEGDMVIHLAWDVKESGSGFSPVIEENKRMGEIMLEIALEKKAKRFILASSAAVSFGYYRHLNSDGTHSAAIQEKIRVTDAPFSLGIYGASKIYLEALGRAYSANGLQVIAARFGNIRRDNDHSVYPFSLSHRDCRQFIEKCLTAENLPQFSIYFVTSNNACNPFDISNAKMDLGYEPEDSSPCLIKNNS